MTPDTTTPRRLPDPRYLRGMSRLALQRGFPSLAAHYAMAAEDAEHAPPPPPPERPRFNAPRVRP